MITGINSHEAYRNITNGDMTAIGRTTSVVPMGLRFELGDEITLTVARTTIC
jgi:hypothetical protein